MQEVLQMLLKVWFDYFQFIRNWKVIDNISLFDILIAVLIIGTLIPILFNIIGSSSWISNKTTIEHRKRTENQRRESNKR